MLGGLDGFLSLAFRVVLWSHAGMNCLGEPPHRRAGRLSVYNQAAQGVLTMVMHLETLGHSEICTRLLAVYGLIGKVLQIDRPPSFPAPESTQVQQD